MTNEHETMAGHSSALPAGYPFLRHELHHLRAHWWWLMLLGVLLAACGTAAIIFPYISVLTTLTITIVLGILLMAAGIATIIGAFWAGKWSGLLVQLLVGILYVVCGFAISENPGGAAIGMTLFIALAFIVLGLFRTIGALLYHFPQWGWALLNGVVTFLAGVVIYRHLPDDSLWVIGLLVGLEMLFNGWTWIMLSLAIRDLPETTG